MPNGSTPDAYGGWLLPIYQHWWGHRAEKPTVLYVCGIPPRDAPQMPMSFDKVMCKTVSLAGFRKGMPGWRGEVNKKEREQTPPRLAEWLVALARRCAC